MAGALKWAGSLRLVGALKRAGSLRLVGALKWAGSECPFSGTRGALCLMGLGPELCVLGSREALRLKGRRGPSCL